MVEIARSMLKQKPLPHKVWGEVVFTVANVLNRCPTKNLKNQVPEECWLGSKPCITHLRVFGSLCYRHVPDERRTKLEDKSEPMILVGYHPTGAYRLYNPVTEKLLVSRDVILREVKSCIGTKVDKKKKWFQCRLQ